nr:MAG TPA: hypothetical protein [Caudoviricetes sp.]
MQVVAPTCVGTHGLLLGYGQNLHKLSCLTDRFDSCAVLLFRYCKRTNVYRKCACCTHPKRQHVLIDYTTTNQTYGACCRHSVSVICDEKTYQR